VYKEIFIPKTSPINITVDLDLKEVEPIQAGAKTSDKLVPIELTISAKNPSTREIHLQVAPPFRLFFGRRVGNLIQVSKQRFHPVSHKTRDKSLP
jgi:hypothetical protein